MYLKKKLPPIKPSVKQPDEASIYFEIHPVLKEIKFLFSPRSLLYPPGDNFEFKNEVLTRGGEPYHQPVGWIRYALNVSFAYKDTNKWCSNDGNPDEWAVVYHGFKISPLKLLHSRLLDKNSKFNPSFTPSDNLRFATDLDINKRSTGYNQQCGLGVLTSPKAELAQSHTVPFMVNDVKYKMLLQCRANPTKLRIPKSNTNIRIINSGEDIRPYGILLKKF